MRIAALVLCATFAAAQTNAPPRTLTLEATGSASARPDVFYLLMKMERASNQAADATGGGEKQTLEFVRAVEALKVPGLTWRISNNVFTAVPSPYSQGAAYSRNIIFTLPNDQSDAERDRLVAQIQDLGAKYDSHCVTCIGSG